MCDTFVALPDSTLDGSVIFGKNSDRPADEIQDVVIYESQNYQPGELLQCTYISIPQIEKTLAVILSKPRWMWGAEMGANECGVVIGNEAVWTTQPYQNTGLLGMDLLRLGLERGESAAHALEIMINLLETYGQGGNCAENFSMNYHNSFIIADFQEAWVLETASKYWVAERVTSGTRSISNNLSIRNQGDHRHPEVIQDCIKMGLCDSEETFDFAQIFSAYGVDDSLSPASREGRVRQLCQVNQGKFSIDVAQSILREHTGNICMHGDFISAGSQVSSLSKNCYEHWFIEQPFPCRQTYQKKEFSHHKLANISSVS
jgi:secernin